MQNENEQTLKRAMAGDINAFQQLFAVFQPQLKSYLYRLVTDRNDAEDLAHDTFIRAFDKLSGFKGNSSFKTWVFQIATNLALDHQRKFKRWSVDTKQIAKELVLNNKTVRDTLWQAGQSSPEGTFDINDHIDHCFTCMGKTLAIEKQVVLILKDIYDFSIKEIASIIDKSQDVSKHLLQDARNTMVTIFDHRCALINKNGICNQCSELNGIFNPKQNQQEVMNQLDLVKGSKKYNREELFELRTKLIKAVDPVRGKGADLQDLLMKCDRMGMGELPIPLN
ncbi:MAG: sigma-70 family RNA polymerase sigma factor [Cyclobacteriaceae bacterium]|jgi:RNA polymerase sigma-70 factor (ECF subfamily)|nr:sigma-70 family RNA polymerase sigma factor [Cyclobacteriaceae bacterium]